jgi:hypothetical protein
MSTLPIPSPSTSAPPTAEPSHQLELAVKDAIPEIIWQARHACRRDLPTLLTNHPGQWVAYHGQRQVAVGHNKTELVQQCLSAGLGRGEFLVLRIEPEIEQQVTVPVDV